MVLFLIPAFSLTSPHGPDVAFVRVPDPNLKEYRSGRRKNVPLSG
jgi:hypothetical protein